MRHLDLFSGIGGFSLAAQTIWQEAHEIVAFCEIDEFCQKVLKKHWPQVPIHEDIKALNAQQWHGTIDPLTGGFPCQPYSLAGKRTGAADDRALWPEMFRIIEECRPRWVVGENVPGIVTMEQPTYLYSLEEYNAAINAALQGAIDFRPEIGVRVRIVMGDIAEDFERIGYKVYAIAVPACAVDAPHIRERVWILANFHGTGSGTLRQNKNKARTKQARCNGDTNVADTDKSNSQEQCRAESVSQKFSAAGCNGSNASNAQSQRCSNGHDGQLQRQTGGEINASASTSGIARELESGRWPTEPAVCVLDDGLPDGLAGYRGRISKGIPNRVNKLKALGNAIVPQVAIEIFRLIKAIEENEF